MKLCHKLMNILNDALAHWNDFVCQYFETYSVSVELMIFVDNKLYVAIHLKI